MLPTIVFRASEAFEVTKIIVRIAPESLKMSPTIVFITPKPSGMVKMIVFTTSKGLGDAPTIVFIKFSTNNRQPAFFESPLKYPNFIIAITFYTIISKSYSISWNICRIYL